MTKQAAKDAPRAALNGAPPAADAWALTDVITRMRRVLRASVRHDFSWESLPMAQVEILQRLAEDPNLGVSELAARQRLAKNTVSNLVQQMVAAGLVDRLPRPGDRRAVNLQLTAKGASLLKAWQGANERRLAEALARLPDGVQETIAGAVPALEELATMLERDEQADVGPQATPGPAKAGPEAAARPDAAVEPALLYDAQHRPI